MLSGEIQIRVRYAETDRMGLLHHANYLVYFEQARTELLRGRHASYKELEDQGYFLVVAKAEVRFTCSTLHQVGTSNWSTGVRVPRMPAQCTSPSRRP